MSSSKPLKIGIVQRVLPGYRSALFDMLSDAYDGRVSVFAGKSRKNEMIHAVRPSRAHYQPARNIHLFDGPFYLCWQYGLMSWLENWKPDVLIMEANPRYIHSSAAIRWMQRKGGKIIGWGLGAPDPGRDIAGLRRTARKRFLKQFDAMVTYSSKGAEEYQALGIAKNDIFVAPNAAAPKPKHAMPERDERFRGGLPTVVFVGRLQTRKHVDALIYACKAQPEGIRPRLWIIGDGPQRFLLEELAKEIYPKTEFLGAQHGDALARYLKLADLFVLPGTGGLAVQEAMAYGLPVVVGVADGTQTDLVRPENGWLLDGDSHLELQTVITEALSNIRRLRDMGKSSYQIVNNEINLDNMVKVFIEAINKVPRE